MKIYLCQCGAIPIYKSWRAGEDIMEGEFYCPKCGASPNEPVEHVWGGDEMKMLAAEVWNEHLSRTIQQEKRRNA